jgi:hypothetical protein
MAFERPVLDIPGIIAGEDFSSAGSLTGLNSTGQFLFVKLPTNGTDLTVVHCNAHHDRPIGVSQGNSKSGDALQVRAIGVTKVVAGSAIKRGQNIGTDNAGRGVPKNETSTGADYGDYVAGIALDSVAAAGSVFSCLISSPYRI